MKVWRDGVAALSGSTVCVLTVDFVHWLLTAFGQRPQHFGFLVVLLPACFTFGTTYVFVRGKLGLTAQLESAWSLVSVVCMWVSLCAVLWVTDFRSFHLPVWARLVLDMGIGVMNWWAFHEGLERKNPPQTENLVVKR